MQLQTLRKKVGLSQEGLAKKTGLSRVSITRYESGTQQPSLESLKCIATALDCTIDELLAGVSKKEEM